MEKKNDWLDMNLKVIQIICRQLYDYYMKGSYGGELPLLQIERLLKQSVEEINRLQIEINSFSKRIKELEVINSPEQEEKTESE